MRPLPVLPSLVLLSILHLILPVINAKCCRADAGGDCGDNSPGTPCCGYKPCNGFCCACKGVSVIREVVETRYSGTYYEWTTVITAPYIWESSRYETWTCRASHVTSWDLPPDTTAAQLKVRTAATVTPSADDRNREYGHARSSRYSSHLNQSTFTTLPVRLHVLQDSIPDTTSTESIFNSVCKGTKVNGTYVITIAEYFKYFEVADETRDSTYGQNVFRKFHKHDRNGDGVLTFDEVRLQCDADTCYE